MAYISVVQLSGIPFIILKLSSLGVTLRYALGGMNDKPSVPVPPASSTTFMLAGSLK